MYTTLVCNTRRNYQTARDHSLRDHFIRDHWLPIYI